MSQFRSKSAPCNGHVTKSNSHVIVIPTFINRQGKRITPLEPSICTTTQTPTLTPIRKKINHFIDMVGHLSVSDDENCYYHKDEI